MQCNVFSGKIGLYKEVGRIINFTWSKKVESLVANLKVELRLEKQVIAWELNKVT